jgi:hypothetical protein
MSGSRGSVPSEDTPRGSVPGQDTPPGFVPGQDAPRGFVTGHDAGEIEKKMKVYREYIDWPDSGILHALKIHHHLESPSREILLTVAQRAGEQIGSKPDRITQRHRGFLIAWLNMHFEQIHDLIPQLALASTTETASELQVAEPKTAEPK